MTPFDALAHLPDLVGRYQQTAADLIRANQELAAQKTDQYVPLEWVCDYWSVSADTARDMMAILAKRKADIKVLSYNRKVVRYRRSDIERITSENLVSLADMVTQKRAAKANR